MDALTADEPPEGLTADALHEQTYQTVVKRESNNKSTFVDNRNIVETGFEESLYSEGKIAAIEALNDQESEGDVEDAALEAMEDSATTVQKNFLKSWNESLSELDSLGAALNDHEDLDHKDALRLEFQDSTGNTYETPVEKDAESYELADGSSFDLHKVYVEGYEDEYITPVEMTAEEDIHVQASNPEDDEWLDYLIYEDWNDILTLLEDTVDDVRDGLITWVEGVYDDVQAGDLDTNELLTPREMAEMSSEDGVNQAMADLMALNIPADLEREATISIDKGDYEAELSGTIAATSEDETIESGETYDPEDDLDGDVYFTYDLNGEGEWFEYDAEKGVDGGEVDFTAEPLDDVTYQIVTEDDETAEVTRDDFKAYDSDDEELDELDDTDADYWRVDVKDDLENAVVDIKRIDLRTEGDETQYETTLLTDKFTVERIENEDGEEEDSLDFERSEPQDDENYISEDEWKEMEDRNERLIEKYEEAKEEDEALIGPGFGDTVDEVKDSIVGLAIIGGVLLVMVSVVVDKIPFIGGK
ncbi:hypothetical protein ACFQHN_01585 [Natrialbaceae archaeon GCM10025896]